MRMLVCFLLLLPAVLAQPAPARASAMACADAIRHAERAAPQVPAGLLYAIALTESAYRPDGMRITVPWPWTINSPKGSFYLGSRREAVAKVEELQAMGVRNIDVGCMQINLRHHPDAFRSLDEAFRPERNVGYALRFLTGLERKAPSLFAAVGRYHSHTPGLSEAYARRVFARWEDGELEIPTKHGLGLPDSQRLVDLGAPTARSSRERSSGPGSWQRVYGASSTSGTSRSLAPTPPSSWLHRDDGTRREVPRGAGQITFR